MREAVVVFPHQLYEDHPALTRNRPVFLVEEQLCFGDWSYPARFHQQKLVLHRASMSAYAARLRRRRLSVTYIDHAPDPHMGYLFSPLRKSRVRRIVLLDPVDFMLRKRLLREAAACGMELEFLPCPGFLTDPQTWTAWLKGKKRFTMASFYRLQRERLDVLIKDGKPVGGRWSLDAENRKPLPKGLRIPTVDFPKPNRHVRDAIRHVADRYPDNPGRAAAYRWPVTHDQAQAFLQDFLRHRFADFGTYEDAIASEEPFLFHSLLSPLLNTGLLTPRQVLDATLTAASRQGTPLNSLEGFVRQIIGWREFVRAIYELDGVRQRTANAWGLSRSMPAAFYDGTTGIEPVDTVIHRLLNHGYTHHIERLMILGNFMLLCELNPDDVYRWFMELFVDAYDWVMVPNVYGMSQYAEGGRMVSKPYISGSSYVRRMSDFGRGPWCDVWDGLFWRFVNRHRGVLKRNHRMAMMVRQYDRMEAGRRGKLIAQAESFLDGLVGR